MATGRREIPFRLTAENRTQAAFRELRRDVRRVNQLGSTLAGVFGVAFGAAGISALAQGLRQVFNELDETAKKAAELGFELEELASTRFVGNIVGVDEQQLDRIFTRLQNFQALAEQGFARETVSSTLDLNAAAARSLGLSEQALEGLSRRELFTAIVDGLRRIERQSDRVRTATQIAGQRGAQALLRFAALSPDQFSGLTEEFRRLGGISDELAEKSEAVNDAFTRVNTATFALVQRELNGLLGSVEDIVRAGRIAAESIGNFGQRTQPDITPFESPLGFVLQELESIRQAFRGAQEEVTGIAPQPGQFERLFSAAGDFAAIWNREILEVRRSLLGLFSLGDEPILGEQETQINAVLDLARGEDAVTQALEDQNASRQRQLRLQQEQADQARSIAEQEAENARRLELERQRRQAAQETRQLQQSAQLLLGQQPQQQQAGVGTERAFQNAVNLAQQTDPNTQLLQGILEELRKRETEAAINRLAELLPRLNNPVFT